MDLSNRQTMLATLIFDVPTVTLITALFAGAITIWGWIYQRTREDHTRRLELTRKHLEKQIEEFYGPLLNLLHTMDVHWEVLQQLMKVEKDGSGSTEEEKSKIREFLENSFFLPVHEEITKLLKTRLYLVEGKQIPPPMVQYLEYFAQHKAQRQIYTDLGIKTEHVRGRAWPASFYEVVKRGFDATMSRYEDCTQALGSKEKPRRLSIHDSFPVCFLVCLMAWG
jgi:hypothetical protein